MFLPATTVVISSVVNQMYVDNYRMKLHGLGQKECDKIGVLETEQTYGKQVCATTYAWRSPIYAEIPGPLGIGKQSIMIEKGYCYIGMVCQG